jgi:hypothetical protein
VSIERESVTLAVSKGINNDFSQICRKKCGNYYGVEFVKKRYRVKIL